MTTSQRTAKLYHPSEYETCSIIEINPGDYFMSRYGSSVYNKVAFTGGFAGMDQDQLLFQIGSYEGMLCTGKDFLAEGSILQKDYAESGIYRKRTSEEIERLSTFLQIVSCEGKIGWINSPSQDYWEGIFLLKAGSITRNLRKPFKPKQ